MAMPEQTFAAQLEALNQDTVELFCKGQQLRVC